MQGMNMVGWGDYAGIDGFGSATVEEVSQLNKALSAGNDINNPGAAPGVGFPLRVESLEATLANTTYRMEHVRLWRAIPKAPAYNTVEEFNQITDYGSGAMNSFVAEGELPQESDSTYVRNYSVVKFLGVQRRVTHVAASTKPAHGNVIAQEVVAGTMKLVRDIERNLWFGRDDLDAVQWKGIEQLIEEGALADNVIDMRGAPLNEDVLIDGALTIQDAPNYGMGTHIHMNPKVKADLVKSFFPKGRYEIGGSGSDGMIGGDRKGIETPAGPLLFESNVFLGDGDGEDGLVPTAAAGSVSMRPGTPVIATALTTGSATTLFTVQDLGTYTYSVVAYNRYGHSAPLSIGSAAVSTALTQTLTFKVSAGAGVAPTFYKIYRTVAGGAASTARLIKRMSAATMASTGFIDTNADLPGTYKCFMLQQDRSNFCFKQLAPMLKMPLAVIDPTIRWMQLLYGVIQMYTPRHNVIYKNVGRSAGYVGTI